MCARERNDGKRVNEGRKGLCVVLQNFKDERERLERTSIQVPVISVQKIVGSDP